MAYGTTPYVKRFGPVEIKAIPFGSSCRYMPLDQGKVVKDHPVGDKTFPSIFLGYHSSPGGKWTGDYWVIDAETLAHADSIHHVKPLRVKDIVVPDYPTFPVRDGSLKQPEMSRQQVEVQDAIDVSHETAEPDPADEFDQIIAEMDPDVREEHPPDSMSDTDSDFWSFNGTVLVRHHLVPRFALYQPDETCPIPLKFLDVHRETKTDLPEKAYKNIKDYWDGTPMDCRELSDAWVGQTNFELLYPVQPAGYKIFGGRLTKVEDSEKPEEIWPAVLSRVTSAQRKDS